MDRGQSPVYEPRRPVTIRKRFPDSLSHPILRSTSSGHHETHSAEIVNRAQRVPAVAAQFLDDRARRLYPRARDDPDLRRDPFDRGRQNRAVAGEQLMQLQNVRAFWVIRGDDASPQTLERGFRERTRHGMVVAPRAAWA